jgi:UPF0042 nucleotide-binding protein
MTPKSRQPGRPLPRKVAKRAKPAKKSAKELVIVTGISGAGKASALKAFEDLGFIASIICRWSFCPILPALVSKSQEVEKAAIVVDVREGSTLDRLPQILKACKNAAADAGGVSGCAGCFAGAALL